MANNKQQTTNNKQHFANIYKVNQQYNKYERYHKYNLYYGYLQYYHNYNKIN